MSSEPLVALAINDRHLGAAIVEAIHQLWAGPPGVQWRNDGTRHHHRKERDGPFRQVAHGQRHAVALFDTHALQRCRERQCRSRECIIGGSIVLVDEKSSRTETATEQEQVGECRRHVFPKSLWRDPQPRPRPFRTERLASSAARGPRQATSSARSFWTPYLSSASQGHERMRTGLKSHEFSPWPVEGGDGNTAIHYRRSPLDAVRSIPRHRGVVTRTTRRRRLRDPADLARE